jgi:NAD(P)-dependent dehydrogenase (short-subunit alcohol dehydrogenase family)
MKVEGVSAIVTGGASGLGAATARLLSKLGATVAVFDVNRSQGEALAQEVSGFSIRCSMARPCVWTAPSAWRRSNQSSAIPPT